MIKNVLCTDETAIFPKALDGATVIFYLVWESYLILSQAILILEVCEIWCPLGPKIDPTKGSLVKSSSSPSPWRVCARSAAFIVVLGTLDQCVGLVGCLPVFLSLNRLNTTKMLTAPMLFLTPASQWERSWPPGKYNTAVFSVTNWPQILWSVSAHFRNWYFCGVSLNIVAPKVMV